MSNPANPIRLGIETALCNRTAGLLDFVYCRQRTSIPGLPVLAPISIVPTGSNPLYNDPIGWSITLFGLSIADYTNIVDTDLQPLTSNQNYYDALDLAEYRLIQSALNSYTETDRGSQDRSASWNAMANRYQGRLDKLEALYVNRLTAPQSVATYRSIRLPIAPNPAKYPGTFY